jgi:transposase
MHNEINPAAAAIDVGSEKLYTALASGPVQVFDTFTAGLYQLRDHLQKHQIKTVAMEATGVYWLPVYEVLESAGIKVCVVNGAHVKNVPGRKTDMADCQWLAYLHGKGMLKSGFIPPAQIRQLRDYNRLRQDHIQMASSHILHMQKALDLMNVKIHDVLTQTIGASALRMIRAILAGERDPKVLLNLCDEQVIKKKRQRVLQALQGTWQQSYLFALQQAVDGWDFYQRQIGQCDQQIQQSLEKLAQNCPTMPSKTNGKIKRLHHNAPKIPALHELLVKINGTDLSRIPTLSDYTLMQILSEVGADITRWATAKQFVSWLGLSPGLRDSGKRKRSEKRFRGRAGRLFCVAARSLAQSKYLALGGFYRRIRGKRGGEVAIIAAARKIALLFYNTLRYGWEYVEQGLEKYEQQYQQQSLQRLRKAAQRFGMTLVPQLS